MGCFTIPSSVILLVLLKVIKKQEWRMESGGSPGVMSGDPTGRGEDLET